MSQIIELSGESAASLKQQAAAHGLTVDAWVRRSRERARTDDVQPCGDFIFFENAHCHWQSRPFGRLDPLESGSAG